MSRSSWKFLIFMIYVSCFCRNGHYTFFKSSSRSHGRTLSEKPVNTEINAIAENAILELNALDTEKNSSPVRNQGSQKFFEDVKSSKYLDISVLEERLKREWNDLARSETKNWFNVIIGICDTLVAECDSYIVCDDKVNSWCELLKMLTSFRLAEINESNVIFEKFLDYMREKKRENPSNTLDEEEENIWNDIKQLKQKKDSEWKKYHVATWRYWFQREFPTVNLIQQ
ncbi:ring-exported protein 3 [Plasmodium gonderi]|uniref:Ring-exported protein 3 n=1 Tax=Plasmodium gonderi TaxID=77519 RepID=A0A1Y1JCE2_PLAGO|nr:ring-exported protein 3 [Plasmodium gonderi]GAW79025.1 ring-exported protein 3 [Plasmodium gonderi]